MSVGGAGRKGMNVSVPGRYRNSRVKPPQQHSMEVQTRGKQLAAAGGTAAAATNSSFCYIAASTAAEPERLAVSNPQQKNSNSISYNASEPDQHHLLQDSVPLGMVGFYGESSSATTREFFQAKSNPGNFQAVLEASSKANNYSEIEEDERQVGQRQGDSMLSSLQLRSPVPGDTASPSPCSQQNGVSLPPGGNPGKFIHNKSEFHLPDMPTSSAAGSPSSSCPINGQVSPTVLLAELVSPPSFQLNPVMYHKATTSMDISTEEKIHDEHMICLWDSCHREFPSLARLVVHLDKCHTLAMSQFVCHWENCPRQLKPFDARYKLTTHLRCHTGEKPYQCDISACKRSFSRLENLKLHTRTHTGEKPYQCHFAGCTKKFNNTSDRAKHMKTHITRKPYTCKHPGCNKSYTDPSSMRKHTNYTHKLSERDMEGGQGLSLTALPRRKRNSTSGSSSNMPLTPQKLQMQQQYQGAILLNSPPTTPLHDPSHPILKTVLSSPQTNPVGVTGGLSFGCCSSTSLVNNSAQQQIIPIVKLHGGSGVGRVQGGQPLLLPTYQQQPLMMILPNSSTSMASHATPMQTATIAVAQDTSCVQNHQAYSSTTTSTCSTSVEDQLRRQIVHLQQQLYRSQLAVAAATATACTTTTTTRGSAAPSSSSQASAVGVVSHPIDNLNTKPHTQFEICAMPLGTDVTPTPHRMRANINLARTGSLPETFTLSQPPARLMGTAQLAGGTNGSGPTLSSSAVGVVGGRGPMLMSTSSMPLLGVEGSARPVPQFIPLIHSQGVTAEPQFLYMSP